MLIKFRRKEQIIVSVDKVQKKRTDNSFLSQIHSPSPLPKEKNKAFLFLAFGSFEFLCPQPQLHNLDPTVPKNTFYYLISVLFLLLN